MKPIKIFIPIYDCYCTLYVTDNVTLSAKKVLSRGKWKKEKIVLDEGECYGLCVSGGSSIKDYLIFLSTTSLYISTICHEISHLIDSIIQHREVENNGESRAYLTGYITDKIFSSLAKHNLLKDKYLLKTKENI